MKRQSENQDVAAPKRLKLMTPNEKSNHVAFKYTEEERYKETETSFYDMHNALCRLMDNRFHYNRYADPQSIIKYIAPDKNNLVGVNDFFKAAHYITKLVTKISFRWTYARYHNYAVDNHLSEKDMEKPFNITELQFEDDDMRTLITVQNGLFAAYRFFEAEERLFNYFKSHNSTPEKTKVFHLDAFVVLKANYGLLELAIDRLKKLIITCRSKGIHYRFYKNRNKADNNYYDDIDRFDTFICVIRFFFNFYFNNTQ